jgi:hypothetical protein
MAAAAVMNAALEDDMPGEFIQYITRKNMMIAMIILASSMKTYLMQRWIASLDSNSDAWE